jgi:type I restriction enzyme S subunit
VRTVPLRDVATTGSGGTPKRSEPAYFGDGTPWLSIADLNDGVVTTAKESLTEAGIANSSAKLVPAGTLLIAMYGSIGKLGIAGRELCTSQAIAFVRPDPNQVDLRYLFHYFLAERPRLLALGRGGTQMNIGQGDLKEWLLPLPSLGEQRRIAAILDQADNIRTKRRQVLAHLDMLDSALFDEIFGGRLEGSERVEFKELASLITKGTTPTSVGLNFSAHGVPFLRVQNLNQGTVRFGSGDLFIDDDAHFSLRRSKIHPQDLLISIAGTIGRTAIVPIDAPEMNCNQAVAIIRLKDPSAGTFMQAWLATPDARKQITASSVTATIANLSLSQIGALKVPVFGQDAKREFAFRVGQVNKVRADAMAALVRYDALFATLQSRAFRGEL